MGNKKKMVQVTVSYTLDWEYDTEISAIREDLDAIEKLGATHVSIEKYTEYDCTYLDIKAQMHRLETDEEYAIRTTKEEMYKRETKRKELEMLERLTAKYKSNTEQ